MGSPKKLVGGPINPLERILALNSLLFSLTYCYSIFFYQLAALREKELKKGNKNRATLAVAKKLVAYMMGWQ